jgi:hypothetical protein
MSPKARKPKGAPFDDDMTGKVAHDPDPVDPADEELDEVFAEFPQNEACIELYRTTEKGGKPAFLDDIMPSDFSFGYVCNQYGGGNYIVKGKYKDGSTVKRSFLIEGDPYPIKRKVPLSPVAPIAPVLERQPERVDVIRNENGQPDALATVVSMMKTLVVELRSSEDQVLDKMMKYKTLFGGGEKPITPVAEAISMIKTGIELGSTSNGEAGGIPWLMIVDKLQGPLTEVALAFKNAMSRPTVVNPGAPIQPTPAMGQPAQPAQPAQGEPKSMEMILLGAMKELLPMLVTGAAQKAEPEFYSDLLLDQIPRTFYATAKVWLEKPDCLDQLARLNPAVNNDRLWFESLRSVLTDALKTELGDAPRTLQPEQAPNAATDRSADL